MKYTAQKPNGNHIIECTDREWKAIQQMIIRYGDSGDTRNGYPTEDHPIADWIEAMLLFTGHVKQIREAQDLLNVMAEKFGDKE